MFETPALPPSRLRPLAASAALHLALGAAVALGPLLALSEPPGPELRPGVTWQPLLPLRLGPSRAPSTGGPRGAPPRAPSRGPSLPPPRLLAPAAVPDALPHPAAPADAGAPDEEAPAGGAWGVAGGDPDATDGDGPPGGDGGPADGPIDARGALPPGVVAPVPLETPRPRYPDAAVALRQQGVVVLDAWIDADGTIRRLEVVRSAGPLLDRAALDAVRGWRYRPALIGSRAVPVLLSVTVTFALR